MVYKSYREDLQVAVGELENRLNAIRAKFESEFPGVAPELVQDSSGRFILLDASAALVNALAVLAKLEGER